MSCQAVTLEQEKSAGTAGYVPKVTCDCPVLGGPRLDNAMSGPTNSTLIRKQARADAPRLEMSVGKGKKADDVVDTNLIPRIPPRVQSRINLQTGTNKFGMKHILKEHLSGKTNKSQFNLSEDGLRQLLQSKQVVDSPIVKTLQSRTHGTLYVRQVDVGRTIGTDVLSRHKSTSILTTQTDMYGNLITAFPGV